MYIIYHSEDEIELINLLLWKVAHHGQEDDEIFKCFIVGGFLFRSDVPSPAGAFFTRMTRKSKRNRVWSVFSKKRKSLQINILTETRARINNRNTHTLEE